MQFTTKTLLVLFIVVASSFAAFGPWGFVVTLICVIAIGFHVWRNCGCILAFVGLVIVAMLLLVPVVITAREAARRACCANCLKCIGLALHNYHNTYGCFPPAYVADDQGNRLHSWRVLMLPYLDETPTYQAYNFNEPWNSPNNSKLAANVYYYWKCLSVLCGNKPLTHYVAVTGPGTAWPGDHGSQLDEFTDGPQNTILLIELSDSDIEWMEPRDITLDEALGPQGGQTRIPRSNHYNAGNYFFHNRPIAGHVLMADGSVRSIEGRLTRDDMAALLSITGGEKVGINEVIKRNTLTITSLKYFRWDHGIGLPLFFLSLIWFWRRLLADSKLNPKSEPQP